MTEAQQLFTIKEASEWATQYLSKTVTTANISYLIQYGRIKKIGENGMAQVLKQELINYYRRKWGQTYKIHFTNRKNGDIFFIWQGS